MDTSTYGARREVRLRVAVVLTVLTALQVVTLVVLAVGGGPRQYAMVFFITGLWGLVLGWMTTIAWRWVARATHEQGLHAPLEGVLDDGGRQDHIGLTGEVEPPKRW